MGSRLARRPARGSQAGFSLIEVLVAGVVLVVGLLALTGLIATAIATNSRAKSDTTAALLAQLALEEIATEPANSSNTVNLSDCAGNHWSMAVAAGGASLSGAIIDFSQSAGSLPNYNMQYMVCAGPARTAYDVRWNVQALTSNTSLVTVGVRRKGSMGDLRLFALPVTLRGYVGR